jgi:hypothetical protein
MMRNLFLEWPAGGKFQNSEDWAALEAPDDGRRTTGAPDDRFSRGLGSVGRRTTGAPDDGFSRGLGSVGITGRRTADDARRTTGSPDLYGERFRREREVFVLKSEI